MAASSALDRPLLIGACLSTADEPEPGWRPGDQILVDMPDGPVVRCRIVNVAEDGTIQVIPEHEVVVR